MVFGNQYFFLFILFYKITTTTKLNRGDKITHFLPLVINKRHAERIDPMIYQYLYLLQNPEISLHANQIVLNFIKNRKNRHKNIIPDLGKFLIYLLISNYEWDDIAIPFVEESFTRKILWLIKKYPNLNNLDADMNYANQY